MNFLLSILLMAMLPCILAISYDRQTVLDNTGWAIEQRKISKVFHLVDEILGDSSQEKSATLRESIREKLPAIIGTIEISDQEGEEINEAVDLLESLEQANSWCNLYGYHSLLRAYLSATYRTGSLDASSPTSRMVIKALKKHGQACRPQYAFDFSQVELEPFERVFAGKVDKALGPDVIDLLFPGEDLKARVRATDIVPDRFVAHVPRGLFMSGLNQAAKRTADKIDVNADLSEKDLLRHLIEPCQSYVDNYGEIFLSARLDLALDEKKISQINPMNKVAFTSAWIKFRVCSALALNNTKETLSLINEKLSRD